MKTHRRHLTSHQRQRYLLWALAMLSWIAAVLFSGKAIAARHRRQREFVSLDRLTRMTVHLLVIRAADLSRKRRRKKRWFRHGADLRRSHLYRRLLGSKLRRPFKHKHIGARVAGLIDVLRNLDTFAQRLALRLRGGLTRLWPKLTARTPAERVPGAPILAVAAADSS